MSDMIEIVGKKVSNLKPLTEKVLRSGIVDEHMASLMERWGYLPDGAADLVPNKGQEFIDATKEQLESLAEDIAEEVAKKALLRETQLDLDKIRWPVLVKAIRGRTPEALEVLGPAGDCFVAGGINAVVDVMGRYYFRSCDVRPEWFVPGYKLCFNTVASDGRRIEMTEETILEVSELSIGESVVAVQVSTDRPVGLAWKVK